MKRVVLLKPESEGGYSLKLVEFFRKNMLVSLTILIAAVSLIIPAPFMWLAENVSIPLTGIPFLKDYFPSFGLVNLLLCVIMFGMGMTLTTQDFKVVLQRPRDIIIGIFSQYVLMSLFGWVVAKAFTVSGITDSYTAAQIAVGLILLGCVPGGTASNVMTFLAKGDVPLSISITMCTTLLAPGLTPALTLLLAGQWIEVNFWSMFASIVMVVLLPILLGIAVHAVLGSKIDGFKNTLVLLSTICIVLVVGLCVGPNRSQFSSSGAGVIIATVAAVAIHHVLGLVGGWIVAKVFGFSEAKVRTLSLEVGLQNSGLSCTLAKTAFPGTMAILPCVIATVVHQIIGPVVANFFASQPLEKEEVVVGKVIKGVEEVS